MFQYALAFVNNPAPLVRLPGQAGLAPKDWLSLLCLTKVTPAP